LADIEPSHRPLSSELSKDTRKRARRAPDQNGVRAAMGVSAGVTGLVGRVLLYLNTPEGVWDVLASGTGIRRLLQSMRLRRNPSRTKADA
jgi:hypothetical protein